VVHGRIKRACGAHAKDFIIAMIGQNSFFTPVESYTDSCQKTKKVLSQQVIRCTNSQYLRLVVQEPDRNGLAVIRGRFFSGFPFDDFTKKHCLSPLKSLRFTSSAFIYAVGFDLRIDCCNKNFS
jgi:hypothetical protein